MDDRTWSVQRDHVELLQGVAALLSEQGEAIFSCNLRSFKLDYEALAKAGIAAEDITESTIPHDFARNVKIHKCFVIKRVKMR
jgi:23S rRNA (guanine2445-N2)-methyltransferase / 23S rRNA (guanine2069-N7)-methyltransferase